MENKEILSNKQVNINSLEKQTVKLLTELNNLDNYEFKIQHNRSSRINIIFRFLSNDGYVSQDYEQSDIENLIPFFIKSDRIDEGRIYNKIELEGNYDPFIVISLSIKKLSLN
jgi:hypothetical protein